MQEGEAPAGAGRGEALQTVASRRRHTRVLACAGLIAGVIACLPVLLPASDAVQAWTAATRLTARVSALFFLAAFSAGALAQLWRSNATLWLLRERRGVGLGFRAAHLVHLLAVIGLSRIDETPGTVAVIGGGVAYLWLIAMALSSNDRAVKRLGSRRWRLLHGTGMYYLWGIFTLGYLGRVVRDDVPPEHALLFTLMVYVMLLRIYQRVHRSG
jgi:methionine sulfoxide reductase heme-binding subunit